jgi:signal transduction histidine kinase
MRGCGCAPPRAAGSSGTSARTFKKDGTRIFVESHVFPLRDPEGNVIGVIGTARDITSRRKAELERLQLERQLLQAQKMDTIGTLAGGVAHEFNNILSAIIGNMELAVLENPEDQTYKDYHRNVLMSSWRARDLVKRLLSFSRSHEPERRPVRIDQLVAEAASLIRATLPATIELDIEPAPGGHGHPGGRERAPAGAPESRCERGLRDARAARHPHLRHAHRGLRRTPRMRADPASRGPVPGARCGRHRVRGSKPGTSPRSSTPSSRPSP